MAAILRALTTGDTEVGGVAVERVSRVEPEHASVEVGPDGHSEDHTLLELVAHLPVATESLVVGVVVESLMLISKWCAKLE